MRMHAAAGAGLTLILASCAPTAGGAGGSDGEPPARSRQCFSVQQVNNYRQGRIDQLFLRVGRSDVYELNAAGGCRDLDFAQRVALVPDGGAVGTRICTDDWARLIVPGSTSPTSVCRVRISRKLTAEEVEALPPAHRP